MLNTRFRILLYGPIGPEPEIEQPSFWLNGMDLLSYA